MNLFNTKYNTKLYFSEFELNDKRKNIQRTAISATHKIDLASGNR